LMLDLRDVYRKVSSNLHDFTEEHLKNIHSIVALYRGDNSYFNNTIKHYYDEVNNGLEKAVKQSSEIQDAYYNSLKDDIDGFLNDEWRDKWQDALNLEDIYWTSQMNHYGDARLEYSEKEELRTLEKTNVEHFKKAKKAVQKFYKDIDAFTKEAAKKLKLNSNKDWKDKVIGKLNEANSKVADYVATLEEVLYFNKEADWLISRFPDGEYQNIEGLCKIANREEIAKNDYSLTAGRYVGVASQIDEDFDYEARMADVKMELKDLNEEAVQLAEQIQTNLIDLGI